MRIDGVALRNFRNIAAETADFDPECNVIFGENAQGKTNLLESLVCLSRGKSPRCRTDRELIRFGVPQASVTGHIFSRNRDFQVELDYFRDRRRGIRINHVAAKRTADLGGVLRTVFFQPEDLSLLREGAAARRRFLDTALCQLLPAYAAALTAYNRALAQKTRILRDCDSFPGLLDTLPAFNAQLLRYGAPLIRCRARYARRLEEYAAACHGACSGGREKLGIRYQTMETVPDLMETAAQSGEAGEPTARSGEPGRSAARSGALDAIEDAFRVHMEAHRGAELAARQCLSGPHKDDLVFTINGEDARAYSSQGQARTAALSVKLAEREICRDAAGEYPALLLDDVLSELDPRRQEFVLNRIRGGQVFITCCEDDRLPRMLGGKVLRMRSGQLEKA